MDDKLGDLWFPKNGITRGSVGLLECVDLTLTTSPEAVNFFAGHNMASTFFPLASSPDIFYNKTINKREIDILFIGNKYGIRGEGGKAGRTAYRAVSQSIPFMNLFYLKLMSLINILLVS